MCLNLLRTCVSIMYINIHIYRIECYKYRIIYISIYIYLYTYITTSLYIYTNKFIYTYIDNIFISILTYERIMHTYRPTHM